MPYSTSLPFCTLTYTSSIWYAYEVSSFQRVQGLSAIQTSIRFLPMVVVGAGTNVVTGYLVDKVEVRTLVVGSAAITLVPPILMAVIQPQWIFWSAALVAMLLSPLHPDGKDPPPLLAIPAICMCKWPG